MFYIIRSDVNHDFFGLFLNSRGVEEIGDVRDGEAGVSFPGSSAQSSQVEFFGV